MFFSYSKRKRIHMKNNSQTFINLMGKGRPAAAAWIRGNASHPNLGGIVRFYAVSSVGILVNAEIFGLPDNERAFMSNAVNARPLSYFYGMHIHQFGDCRPPFDQTGTHYNPDGTPHPEHAGDMPPLLSSNGYAWLAFYDARLSIDEIVDKSIIIHAGRDDFTSQPAGDAGDKIGCGVIKRIWYR